MQLSPISQPAPIIALSIIQFFPIIEYFPMVSGIYLNVFVSAYDGLKIVSSPMIQYL